MKHELAEACFESSAGQGSTDPRLPIVYGRTKMRHVGPPRTPLPTFVALLPASIRYEPRDETTQSEGP